MFETNGGYRLQAKSSIAEFATVAFRSAATKSARWRLSIGTRDSKVFLTVVKHPKTSSILKRYPIKYGPIGSVSNCLDILMRSGSLTMPFSRTLNP